jgi:hypothetical protein
VLAQRVQSHEGERVDGPFAGLARLFAGFEVAKPGEAPGLDVVLALAAQSRIQPWRAIWRRSCALARWRPTSPRISYEKRFNSFGGMWPVRTSVATAMDHSYYYLRIIV